MTAMEAKHISVSVLSAKIQYGYIRIQTENGTIAPTVEQGWTERSKRMSKVIRAICDNGYDGVLIPNHSMTIRFKGERVFATYSPAPKNYDDLMGVLETMPQFIDMLNEQVKNAISKGARE